VYLLSVLLLMVVLPILSFGEEHFYLHSALPLMSLVRKWFVFLGRGSQTLLRWLTPVLSTSVYG
jgi:hypothetical protein